MDWTSLGDCAWLYQANGPTAREQILGLRMALINAALEKVTDIVTSYKTLAVYFSPENGEAVFQQLETFSNRPEAAQLANQKTIEVPTDYQHQNSEIESVAEHLGMTVEEVIDLHSSPLYEVAAIGFSPGFPYLSGLDARLHLPRKESPSVVARGSVAIAGKQSGIYPNASPGGWHVLGRTDLTLFSPDAPTPSLLQSGDRVRFVPTQLPSPKINPAPQRIASPESDIRVVLPGAFSTIQDRGRSGYRADGVTPGGATDLVFQHIANRLVGNPSSFASIECFGSGPVLAFQREVTVAWLGWENGSGRPHHFRSGEKLDLRGRMNSSSGTIAISGGLEVPVLLGSMATDVRAQMGGLQGRALKSGDTLQIANRTVAIAEPGAWYVGWPHSSKTLEIRTLPGIQEDWFAEDSVHEFGSEVFTKSGSFDRTGAKLDGPKLARKNDREMTSQPVAPGSIQVPPYGVPIVLLSEAQTIGGYPQIGHVISADLPKLARALPGTNIRFLTVDLETARTAWQQHQKELSLLEVGLSLQT